MVEGAGPGRGGPLLFARWLSGPPPTTTIFVLVVVGVVVGSLDLEELITGRWPPGELGGSSGALLSIL